MSLPPLPPCGLASEVLGAADLPPADPADPYRLVNFVQTVAAPARAPAPAPEAPLHLVTFDLAGECYAAPVENVLEIVRVQALTRIPQAPEHVRGVQSLRGAILPVLELRTRVGLPPAETTPRSRILVVEAHGRVVGLLVDGVHQVLRLPRSAVQPPPAEVRSRLSEHVVGMVATAAGMALLLHLDRLLVLPSAPAEVSAR